jgi:uncharacterized protein (DUF1015 family)
MCLGEAWYRLTVRPGAVPDGDAVEALDVQVLYKTVLQPVLGIGDPRDDEKIQ